MSTLDLDALTLIHNIVNVRKQPGIPISLYRVPGRKGKLATGADGKSGRRGRFIHIPPGVLLFHSLNASVILFCMHHQALFVIPASF
jgi:hypothetical protein